jgi:hypothetical protein
MTAVIRLLLVTSAFAGATAVTLWSHAEPVPVGRCYVLTESMRDPVTGLRVHVKRLHCEYTDSERSTIERYHR